MKRCWKIRIGLLLMALVWIGGWGGVAWRRYEYEIWEAVLLWRIERLRERLVMVNPGLPYNRVTINVFDFGWKITTVDPSDCESVRDISPLEGLLLKELNLRHTRVSDLSPLKGMPLESLDLSYTKVSDLTPLNGMALRELSLCKTTISDLSPLRGMPLHKLVAWSSAVTDLSPLTGMPLEVLDLWNTNVSDLTPLKGVPLEELDITDTPAAKKPLPVWLRKRVDAGQCVVSGHVGPEGAGE